MSAWDIASARVDDEDDALDLAPRREPEQPRAQTEIPASPPLVVTDHFDVAQVDLDPRAGATIRMRLLTRLEVMELMQEHRPPVVSLDERGQSFLEKELHLAPGPRATLSPTTKLIVAKRVAWNDVRWYLLEFLGDGDGVVSC